MRSHAAMMSNAHAERLKYVTRACANGMGFGDDSCFKIRGPEELHQPGPAWIAAPDARRGNVVGWTGG
jgi:hypothetical protein